LFSSTEEAPGFQIRKSFAGVREVQFYQGEAKGSPDSDILFFVNSEDSDPAIRINNADSSVTLGTRDSGTLKVGGGLGVNGQVTCDQIQFGDAESEHPLKHWNITTAATTFTGIWDSDRVVNNCIYSKIGGDTYGICSVTVPSYFSTANTEAPIIATLAVSGLGSNTAISFPIVVIDNGTYKMGRCEIDGSNIVIYTSEAGAPFAGTGSSGFIGFSVSWNKIS